MRFEKLPMRALSAGSITSTNASAACCTSEKFGLHAAAAIEQHHDGDRLDVVREQRQLLTPAVVENRERVARQIGNEPAVGARDGRVDRDRAHAAAERRLLQQRRQDSRWAIMTRMALTDAGKKAPAFSLNDQNGKTHRLSDYAGRPVILYFYPKDDTPGCTKESCDFRDKLPKFKKSKAAVLGVSILDEASKKKFADEVRPELSALRRRRSRESPRNTASGRRSRSTGASSWASFGRRT